MEWATESVPRLHHGVPLVRAAKIEGEIGLLPGTDNCGWNSANVADRGYPANLPQGRHLLQRNLYPATLERFDSITRSWCGLSGGRTRSYQGNPAQPGSCL